MMQKVSDQIVIEHFIFSPNPADSARRPEPIPNTYPNLFVVIHEKDGDRIVRPSKWQEYCPEVVTVDVEEKGFFRSKWRKVEIVPAFDAYGIVTDKINPVRIEGFTVQVSGNAVNGTSPLRMDI